MRKFIYQFIALSFATTATFAQATISPAKPQSGTIAIVGGTIHVGNGQVIQNGTVIFSKGKIISVKEGNAVPQDIAIVHAEGKQIYPGFIAPNNALGLVEVQSVRATRDAQETGTINPHVRSLIAYNTESRIIPTVRSNGTLLSQPTPEGGLVSGTSSIVQLDAWNWEDAAYKKDMAVHFNWPTSKQPAEGRRFGGATLTEEQQKERYQKQLTELNNYFAEAKAYASTEKPNTFNARFDAMKGLFNGTKKAMVNVNNQKDIIVAVKFFESFGITPVLVGAEDAVEITGFLKDHNVPIIMYESQSLPANDDDDVYLPYKNAKILHDAGLLIAMSADGYWQQRNLPFMAGVSAAYGLTKEEALATITSNTAKILGIDNMTGTLEVGKDANIIISEGDALDMMTNNITTAFIQGRSIDLNNVQKQLYKKYAEKYGIKAD
ncbi:MAG: amidohydrolase family protein [Bacteroidetes bacterium]|nr:amidohydrolase family protein [Bacteroidota bacterium]MBU1373086.1 amidohydrolase family protein [Bacteroidota bacterium]MBU1484267.1 amidohydrolase family protein [Bacteroidota bacterium]MBU1759940.1 amidohydrolase family protein [Bacteroidota bacterium]MBU2268209.1 amidohydrolase family protein [Bacteroidota bacterium]